MGRPRLRPKPEPQFRPEQMVEVIEPFSLDIPAGLTAEGEPRFTTYTFNYKTRPVRGDHPAVLEHPEYFRAVEQVYQATAGPGERRGDS